MRFGWLISLLLLLIVGGYALWSIHRTGVPFVRTWTVEDPASRDADSVDWQHATDLRFTWGDGSGWHGYDSVKVFPNGNVVYVFRDYAGRGWAWKRAEFTVDPLTVRDLLQLLRDVDYFRLKQAYHAAIEDGTQRFVKVEISGKRKGVYCNNNFPGEILRIKSFVEERVLGQHAHEIAQAQSVEVTRETMETESFPDAANGAPNGSGAGNDEYRDHLARFHDNN